MPDHDHAWARRAAEEIARVTFCGSCDVFSACVPQEGSCTFLEDESQEIAAIILRHAGEEFDKIKRDRDCMTAIHMCLESNEAVSRVLDGCYYTKENTP